MAKPSTKGLLKKILSEDIEWVYIHITNKAMEWTIAGFIDEAINLLEQLWKHNIPHSKNLQYSDEAFQMIWNKAKKKPPNVPFKFSSLTEIDASSWSRNFYMCGDQESIERVLNKPIKDLDPADAYHKIIISGNTTNENIEDILSALERYIDLEKPLGSILARSTLCGVFLAAKHKHPEYTKLFLKLWGEGYLKYWNNFFLPEIARNSNSAEYLLKGDLASVFKLSHELIENETKEIIYTLSKRVKNGRSLVYESLSWKQILDRISQLAIEQETIDFPENIIASRTLSKPSATDLEIKTAERRLNIVFPNDYKKFLSASNGFECFSYTGVTLLPIEKVDFLVKIDEQLVDIWADSLNDIVDGFGDKLRNSIIIGGIGEEQQLLLIPLPDDKWECWHFSSWRPGEVVYESFRFYIEYELQQLEDNRYID